MTWSDRGGEPCPGPWWACECCGLPGRPAGGTADLCARCYPVMPELLELELEGVSGATTAQHRRFRGREARRARARIGKPRP